MGFSGSPSRNFALKLKALKSKLRGWKKENGEYFKFEMANCLVKIKFLDELQEIRL